MKIYLINVEEDDVLKSLQHTQVAICITFKVAHLQILNKMSSRGGIKKKSVIYLSVSLIIVNTQGVKVITSYYISCFFGMN